ncbi:MAG: YceI family protein [Alphaproteobacteria bacterium]|nr:YceI family protein [Alphaproteobacteria bacterium]
MRRPFMILAAALSLSACVSPATTDPAELPSGQWSLDPAHASVTWQVRHLGLSWYTARFDAAEASLSFDPANPQDAQLTAIVDAASVSTGDPDFDDTLRGLGWLAADRHPQIVFRSTRIVVTGETTGRIHGELTLKGVTAEAVLETEFYGGTYNPLEGAQALGFGAYMTIDRTDFGVGNLPGNFIGDEVRLRIEAEFLRD